MTLPPLADLPAWLASREASAPALRPGCEKVVRWQDGPRRTPWSVVYLHGFSASRRETSPWPELVAERLGANFHGGRLTGHGQDGPAMDRATLADWRRDTAEALAVGRAIGERVLVLACSMGATLLTLALAGGEKAEAAVLMSPLYGVRLRRLQAVLDAPFVARWGPLVVRGPQGPPAANIVTGIWTWGYTARAYMPMAHAIRAARRSDLEGVQVPALFAYNDRDAVVDAGLTAQVMRRWGGAAARFVPQPGPGDDPTVHVLAGDALSPSLTLPMVEATLGWLRAL